MDLIPATRRPPFRAFAAPALPLALLLALFLCAAPALAGPAAQARAALESSVTRVLSLIQRPDYVNPATREPLRRQIEDEVYYIFDFGEFSARTVGQAWKGFTPRQKKAFTEAFAELLFATYLSRIDGYNGEKVRYLGERANADETRVEVRTELTLEGGQVLPVDYRMLPKEGGWVVYDVVVEGVSLVKNYRTQFQELLSGASPEEVTARVKAKAAEVDSSHAR